MPGWNSHFINDYEKPPKPKAKYMKNSEFGAAGPLKKTQQQKLTGGFA